MILPPDVDAELADQIRATRVAARIRQAVLDAPTVHERRSRLVAELITTRLAVLGMTMMSRTTVPES